FRYASIEGSILTFFQSWLYMRFRFVVCRWTFSPVRVRLRFFQAVNSKPKPDIHAEGWSTGRSLNTIPRQRYSELKSVSRPKLILWLSAGRWPNFSEAAVCSCKDPLMSAAMPSRMIDPLWGGRSWANKTGNAGRIRINQNVN